MAEDTCMAPITVQIISEKTGRSVEVLNDALNVNIQDQHTTIVDVYMHQHGSDITIDGTPSIGDRTITLETGHGLSANDFIGFKQDGHFFEAEVLVVATNDITLDQPLDYPFTSAADPSHVHTPDMNVDGSSTTQVFHVAPPVGEVWDINRLIFVIEDNSAMDTNKFGGLDALTNGIVLRVVNDITKNVFNVKTNGDFALRSYDVNYDDKSPAGFFGFRCRTTFAGQDKRGVTVRLDGDTADELQILIQDDLRDLSKFRAVPQGHVIGI